MNSTTALRRLAAATMLALCAAPVTAQQAPQSALERPAACAQKAREAGIRGKLKRSAFMSECVGRIETADPGLRRAGEAEREHGGQHRRHREDEHRRHEDRHEGGDDEHHGRRRGKH